MRKIVVMCALFFLLCSVILGSFEFGDVFITATGEVNVDNAAINLNIPPSGVGSLALQGVGILLDIYNQQQLSEKYRIIDRKLGEILGQLKKIDQRLKKIETTLDIMSKTLKQIDARLENLPTDVVGAFLKGYISRTRNKWVRWGNNPNKYRTEINYFFGNFETNLFAFLDSSQTTTKHFLLMSNAYIIHLDLFGLIYNENDPEFRPELIDFLNKYKTYWEKLLNIPQNFNEKEDITPRDSFKAMKKKFIFQINNLLKINRNQPPPGYMRTRQGGENTKVGGFNFEKNEFVSPPLYTFRSRSVPISRVLHPMCGWGNEYNLYCFVELKKNGFENKGFFLYPLILKPHRTKLGGILDCSYQKKIQPGSMENWVKEMEDSRRCFTPGSFGGGVGTIKDQRKSEFVNKIKQANKIYKKLVDTELLIGAAKKIKKDTEDRIEKLKEKGK